MTPTDHAAALTARGFYCFPLLPGKKLPAVKNWNSPSLAEAWAFGLNDNIGIYTGAFRESGALIVVDIDNKGAKRGDETILALELAGKDFPPTLEVATPTGGRHLYYRCAEPVRSGVEVLGPAIDIRSANGFVVAPGSRMDGSAGGDAAVVGTYAFAEPLAELAWAPQWLIDACGRPRERSTIEVKPLEGYAREVAYAKAQKYLNEEAPIAAQGEGGDIGTFKVACRVRDFGVSPADALALMLDWNERCEPPWSMDDLSRKVENAYKYATGDFGGDNPAVVFEPVAAGPGESPSKDGSPDHRGQRQLEPSYTLRKASALFGDPDPEWLIDELFPARGLAIVYGEPSAGKSFLALDIAAAIARGVSWADRAVRQSGSVVYASLEGRQKLRVEAYIQHHNLDRQDLDRVYFIEQQPLNLLDKDNKPVLALRAAIESSVEGPIRAIVIDTLARALPGGNENDSAVMSFAIDAATALGHKFKCLTVLVHHSGKNAAQGARGHSSLHGAADAELHVTYDRENDIRRVRIAKLKDGDDQAAWKFRLQKVALGEGPHGERHSSVVTGLERAATRIEKLTPTQSTVLMALREAASDKATGDVFDEVPVSKEEWREAYYRSEGCDGDKGTPSKRRSLKTKFYDGMNSLVKKGRVARRGADSFVVAQEDEVEP